MRPRFRKPSSAEASDLNAANQPATSTAVLEMPESSPDAYPDLKKNTVWQYMQKLTQEQWVNHTWYLWRTDPSGEFQKGQAKFREKASFPIDESWVEAKYGGYKWKIQLNSYDRKGTATELYIFRFGNESRPKVQPGERLLEPEQPIPVQGAATPVAPPQDNNRLYDMMERMMDRLDRRSDELRHSPREEAEGKALTGALELQAKGMTSGMTLMESIVTKAMGNNTDPLAQFERVGKILKDLNGKQEPAAAAGNVIDQVDKLFDFVEKIRGKADEGKPGGSSNGKYAIVEAITGGVAQILNTPVGQQIGMFLLSKIASAGVAATPGAPIALRPGVTIADNVPLTAAAPVGGVAPNPVTPAEPQQVIVTVDQFEQSKKFLIKQTLVRMFTRGDHGSKIAEAIDNIDTDFAERMCNVMKQAVSNPAVLDSWKADAQLMKLFEFPLPRLIAFGTEYVAYFAEDAADNAEPGTGDEQPAG